MQDFTLTGAWTTMGILGQVNTLFHSDAIWRHWPWSSLVQVMTCRLFGTKPLPNYRKTSSISRTKPQCINGSCVLAQLSSLNPLKPGVKLRTKMRCSNYIWVINNFIAYKGATYIRGFTVILIYCQIQPKEQYQMCELSHNHLHSIKNTWKSIQRCNLNKSRICFMGIEFRVKSSVKRFPDRNLSYLSILFI